MNNQSLREKCFTSDKLAGLNDAEFMSFKKELGTIEINGLEDYFHSLINNGIKVSNECNSIVAYLVELTDVKPVESIKYEGGTIPDVDSDFADDKRLEVVEYIVRRYGSDYVAGIGSYQPMWAKSAIRYAGKALGYPLDQVDVIARLVPELQQGKNWHVDEALEESVELKKMYKENDDVKDIVDWALKIDGVIGSPTQHAAGYVISPFPISDLVPTFRNRENNFPVTEFVMKEVEQLGLVKADFLGLRTLTIIQDCLRIIRERRDITIKFDDIPLDNQEMFSIYATGKLMGVFQMEGEGLSSYSKGYRPNNILDITLILAGYRPGPMQFMKDVMKLKNGLDWEDVKPTAEEYPIIKDVLAETYGYFLYQEQIQKVVEVLAGYNDHEADNFRRIISKKVRKDMDKEKSVFAAKAKLKGMSDEAIEGLWDQMDSFSAYAFNKSHAFAYAVLCVKTAWLKYYYPVEFYAANILNDINNQDKVSQFIEEAKSLNINILPPDINESKDFFNIINDKLIRFGLGGIKGVGQATAQEILREREANGKFMSITDFIYRTNSRSNVIESLIKAGCFDRFAKRAEMFCTIKGKKNPKYIDALIDMVKYCKDREWIPLSFNEEWIDLPVASEYPLIQIVEMEKEMTGIYITMHPVEIYKDVINFIKNKKGNYRAGFAENLKVFKSGKGCKFTLRMLDGTRQDMLIVGRTWKETNIATRIDSLMNDMVVVEFSGRGEDVLFVNKISPLNKVEYDKPKRHKIQIPLTIRGIKIMQKVKDLNMSKEPGSYEVYVELKGSHFSLNRFLGFSQSVSY